MAGVGEGTDNGFGTKHIRNRESVCIMFDVKYE